MRPTDVGVRKPIFGCGINLICADMMALLRLSIAAVAVMRPELVIKSIILVIAVGDFTVAGRCSQCAGLRRVAH